MTPLSKSLEELITDIYKDDNVSVTEYRALRDDADRRMATDRRGDAAIADHCYRFEKSQAD